MVNALDFLDVRHYEGGRSSALAPAAFTPGEIPGTHFSGAELTPEHMVLSVVTVKIPSDTTGNRSRGHPTSSAEP